MIKLKIFLMIMVVVNMALADVRFSSKIGNGFQFRQEGVPLNVDANGNELPDEPGAGTLAYRVPSTFGYDALEDQKDNNNDQFLRSNIDNEANQRNTADEAPQDMLPCRQPTTNNQQYEMQFQLGETVQLPLRWNNPHDSDCELNIWSGQMDQVATLRQPYNCGGGYQNELFNATFPLDFQGCRTPEDGCVLQFYAHSVEPRTYAACIDFFLTDAPIPPGTNPTEILVPSAAPVVAPAPGVPAPVVPAPVVPAPVVPAAVVPAPVVPASVVPAPVVPAAVVPAAVVPPAVAPATATDILSRYGQQQHQRRLDYSLLRDPVEHRRLDEILAQYTAPHHRKLQELTANAECPPVGQWRPAQHFSDSFHTSHVDSDYSFYSGQQYGCTRAEIKAASILASYVGNGGLVPTDDPLQDERDDLRQKLDEEIQEYEEDAIDANKEAQDALDDEGNGECFEGDLYGVRNNADCDRQYTNTYVTNVGYVDILADMMPRYDQAGLDPYTPVLKDGLATPEDTIGAYQDDDGKPSKNPQDRRRRLR